jgi:hypothetical protein
VYLHIIIKYKGRAMAQAVSRWPLTAEAGFAPGSIYVGFVVDKVALGRFSPSTSVFPANISFHNLLHIHLSPPHEVCDCSDQAAHYHNLGRQLGASLLTRHIGWKQKQKVKKKVPSDYCFLRYRKNSFFLGGGVVIPTQIWRTRSWYLCPPETGCPIYEYTPGTGFPP